MEDFAKITRHSGTPQYMQLHRISIKLSRLTRMYIAHVYWASPMICGRYFGQADTFNSKSDKISVQHQYQNTGVLYS